MRVRPKRSTLAILLTAAVVGLALSEFRLRSGLITTQEEVDELVGLGFEDGITMLRSPKSLNSVVEYTYDFDHGNRNFSHTVVIFEGQNQQASYHSDQADGSKQSFRVLATLGSMGSESALTLKNNGVGDVQTVLLRDLRLQTASATL
jgi:hypothetical protein